jgi:cytochrome bd ubiquinol oxidase subunit II
MELLWLAIVAAMITIYVVLDGFDLGAGVLSLAVARSEDDRALILRSIGPVWDGNEVWLLAGGGVLYFAFPQLYASSFSGFYLPLMIVLWLLIGRGISIEIRHLVDSPLWRPFWDKVFGLASLLLAVFFGAALGNVIRGVPIEKSGYFFLPLWTDLGLGPDGLRGQVGILDWYTVLVGVFALATLSLHGACWVTLKTAGELNARSRALAGRLWWAVAALLVLTTLVSFQVQPQILENFSNRPLGFLFPILALTGLAGMRLYRSPDHEARGFLASCLFIVGMLTSAAFGIFPYTLPANSDPALGLTIYNSASTDYSLRVGLMWWIPGTALATAYFVFLYRKFAGKVSLDAPGH